jgi:UDP-glucose-4-epimerase GalE
MCYELKQTYPDCFIIGVDKHVKPHLRHLYDVYIPIDISCNPLYTGAKDIDCIFHFAAYISVEEGERNAWSYYRNNIGSTFGAIDAAKYYGIKNFIFSSTAAVYSQERTTGIFGNTISENDPLGPISVYGKSKLMVEDMLSSVTDMNTAILRYFNACGRNVKANLYEEHDPETHLIPLLVKNKTSMIYGDDWNTEDGTCIRDYVHVEDICKAHTLAYEYIKQNNENIVLNIGSGQGYSVRQVIDKVNRIIHNGNMDIKVTERRNGDVPYLVANNDKLKQLLGFTPQHSLEQIIESMK